MLVISIGYGFIAHIWYGAAGKQEGIALQVTNNFYNIGTIDQRRIGNRFANAPYSHLLSSFTSEQIE
ncbi:hypothetical protein D3C80_1702040 [compost metagenome]